MYFQNHFRKSMRFFSIAYARYNIFQVGKQRILVNFVLLKDVFENIKKFHK